MRGRKPTPTHLKLVAGNPGKRKPSGREPRPLGALLEAPDYLSEAQIADWTYAIAHAPNGLLKKLDREVLAVWVVACDLWKQALRAQAKIDAGKELPLLAKTPNGMAVQSPYVGIISKQSQIMLKASAELGFSPSSRTRIDLEPEDEQDNLESILAS